MNFLSPGVFVLAAALTVPPLVLLYFLKLRRREVPISSTFFWKRAVQDLQVNAPFQRLRRNLLLLLQLIVLLLAALALGRPLLRREEMGKKSLIVMIDRSASMNVTEPDGLTRLQRAQAEAAKLLDQVGREFDRAMVVAFSDRAQMMAPFTGNTAALERAIDAVTPSDGLSRLGEAVALASAHAQSELVGRDAPPGSPVSTAPPAKIVLFSDGRIEDAQTVSLERMEMELVNVGVGDDNVGIVSLSAGRYYERPEMLNVVATVQNFGRVVVEVDVELVIAGRLRDVETTTLGPGVAPPDAAEFDPDRSTRTVSFEQVEFADSGVLEVRLARRDALPIDNSAYAVVPPPRHVKVLLVTPQDVALVPAMQALPVELTVMSLQQYESAPDDDIAEGQRSRFGVVVFDGCSSARLPTGNYLMFGAVPPLEGFAQGDVVEYDPIFNWDETHPILRYVNPQNIFVFKYRRLALPTGTESLIDAEQGSVLSLVSHQGSRYLVCAFGLLDDERRWWNTTWPFRAHFPIFMWNAVQYLSGSLDMEVRAQTRPGDALAIEAAGDSSVVTVERPDGTVDKVPVIGSGTAHYGNTDRIGIYSASPTVAERTLFAVNLFSSNESRIRPNADFVIGGETVESRSAVLSTNVPLWPWLLLGALAFLFLEWAVYSKRVLV